MLNDLAEAIRRWTEKKRPSVKHGNQRIVPAFVSIDAENCTCLRAYKIASLSVLSDVLVQKATM